tara:strand:- start:53 stop:409 length:357 start_codon:yes stop_codon:yes gene_type:complete
LPCFGKKCPLSQASQVVTPQWRGVTISLPVYGSVQRHEIRGGGAAIATVPQLELYFLIVPQARQTGLFDCGNMNKNVLSTVIGCDEAEAFGSIEPFHGANGHSRVSFVSSVRNIATVW